MFLFFSHINSSNKFYNQIYCSFNFQVDYLVNTAAMNATATITKSGMTMTAFDATPANPALLSISMTIEVTYNLYINLGF